MRRLPLCLLCRDHSLPPRYVDEAPDGSRAEVRCTVTRAQLETMARARLLPRLEALCDAAVRAAADAAPALHSVEMIGGGSHVPCVR